MKTCDEHFVYNVLTRECIYKNSVKGKKYIEKVKKCENGLENEDCYIIMKLLKKEKYRLKRRYIRNIMLSLMFVISITVFLIPSLRKRIIDKVSHQFGSDITEFIKKKITYIMKLMTGEMRKNEFKKDLREVLENEVKDMISDPKIEKKLEDYITKFLQNPRIQDESANFLSNSAKTAAKEYIGKWIPWKKSEEEIWYDAPENIVTGILHGKNYPSSYMDSIVSLLVSG